jgi:activator of 2-hydroxyglutaryl-CoA dehydratase
VCTVFAESEVVSLRAEGHSREDIIAGIHKSIASRIRAMMAQTGHINPVVLTGGVAKNAGLVKALEDELQTSLSIPEDPQITGALGAALIGSRACT